MAFRRPARVLAPLALLGALAAILLIVSSSHTGGSASPDPGAISDSSGATTHSAGAGGTTTPTTTTGAGGHASRRSYTVKPGDVLSGIAASTGVPLADIERLNPDVDAQSLHAGQKIKLAP